MTEFTVHLEAAGGSIVVGVERAGQALPFDRRSATRSARNVAAGVDDALSLVRAHCNYSGEELQRAIAGGRIHISLRGEVGLVSIADFHLRVAKGLPVREVARGVSATDHVEPSEVLAEWEALVADDADEALVVLAFREAGERATSGELLLLTIEPDGVSAQELGHCLEVLVGAPLATHAWHDPVDCTVRAQPRAGAASFQVIDGDDRADMLAYLERQGAQRLGDAENERRLGRRAWLLEQRGATCEPGARLGLPFGTTDLWELRLSVERPRIEGVEVAGLFGAQSGIPGRRERGRSLAATSKLHLRLTRAGDTLVLLDGAEEWGRIDAASATVLAACYARQIPNAPARRALDPQLLDRVLELADASGGSASSAVCERVLEALEVSEHADVARRYLDHVLGGELLHVALREWCVANRFGDFGAASLGAALRAAAGRYAQRAGVLRDARANADGRARATVLEELAVRRAALVTERVRDELLEAKSKLLRASARGERARIARGARWTATDLRDALRGALASGEAQELTDRRLGARMREPFECARSGFVELAARLLRESAAAAGDPAAVAVAPVAREAPLPVMTVPLAGLRSPADHTVNELLAKSREAYEPALEDWLETVLDQIARRTLEVALKHEEGQVSTALAEIRAQIPPSGPVDDEALRRIEAIEAGLRRLARRAVE